MPNTFIPHGGSGRWIFCLIQMLTLLLCLFGLSSCSEEKALDTNTQTITLNLWHAYGTGGDEEKALLEVVGDFEKANPNIKVEVLQVPNETMTNKLFTGIPYGNGPDAFIKAHDIIGDWANNKIIADLTPYQASFNLTQYHEATVDAVKFTYTTKDDAGQKIEKPGFFALPLAYKSAVLFYNKATVQNPPQTTSELLKFVETHFDDCAGKGSDCKQHYGLSYLNTDLFLHSTWLNGFGGYVFDADGNVQLNNEGNAKSIEYAKKLNAYMPSGIDGGRLKSMFNDGTTDLVISGPWFMSDIDSSKVNYGVVTLPKIDEPGAPENAYAAPYVTTEGIFMSRDTKASVELAKLSPNDSKYAAIKAVVEARRDATIKLMNYVANEGAYKRMVVGKQMVAYTSAYEQLKADNSEQAKFMKTVAPTFLAQLDHAQSSSNRPDMGSVWATMQQAMQKTLFGGPSGETPYLLFLLLSLVVAGFVFLAKATNPSVTTPKKHQMHIAGTVASFVLALPVFMWLRDVQGSSKNIDIVAALEEAQTRISLLRPLNVEDGNPMTLVAIVCGILAVLCVLGIRAYKKHKASNIEYTDNKVAAAFVAPAVIGMIVLVFLPFIIGAFLSFFSYEYGEFRFVGLQNFVRMFTSGQSSFFDSMSIYFTFVVTVLWTMTNVALHVGIGLCLALLLREPWLKLKGIYRVILIVPWAMPNYITALIWRGMFDHNFGAINNLLQSLGLDRVQWYNEFLTSFAANLTTNTWLGFPFMMVVTLGALQAIPRDLEDAAAVDGATAWQRFRHVTFPLLKPALMPSVVLGSIWTFNAFNIIYLVSKGSPDGSTEILVSEAYKWAFERQYQYGYAAAYAMVVFVILVLYSKLTQLVLNDNTAEAK